MPHPNSTYRVIDSSEDIKDDDPVLQHGGGGGNDGRMEKRIEALEQKFDKMNDKLDAIGKDLSYLRGKVDTLPTTIQLLGFVVAVLAIAGLAKYLSP